uniref:Uncharacterized protein n=1 Tax=Anguilla anguilla TaxID=7936 RepID=A0A0E9XQJ4_ANGAN
MDEHFSNQTFFENTSCNFNQMQTLQTFTNGEHQYCGQFKLVVQLASLTDEQKGLASVSSCS